MNDVVTNPFHAPAKAGPTAIAEPVAQREVAEVQAALIIAKRYPRDPVQATDRILQACTRPGLAEAGLYQYARGGQDVVGPSIRLAEAMARDWGNLVCGVTELSRRDGASEALAYAWDLETNFRDEKRFTVRHVRDTKKGTYAITDERDIYELVANMGARRKRACIIAILPQDVVEAAQRQCEVTVSTKIEITPEFIKEMLARFAQVGVSIGMLETRVQRRIDTITPALAMNLKKIYNSLRDGMSQVADWFEPEQAENGGKTRSGPANLKAAVGAASGGERPPETTDTKPAKEPAQQTSAPGRPPARAVPAQDAPAAEATKTEAKAPRQPEAAAEPSALDELLHVCKNAEMVDDLDFAADLRRGLTDPLDAQKADAAIAEASARVHGKAPE